MSLPDDRVYSMLRRDFVLGWTNIRREEYVGDSFGYSRRQACVGTTNGAGASNVQLFVLSPDRVVLHALPGFWHPDDLARELRFAKMMFRLWQDDGRTLFEKRSMFRRMQLTELRFHSADMYARSDWQGFDKSAEGGRFGAARDTFEKTAKGDVRRTRNGAPVLKPINVLVHSRMASQAFVRFEAFDISGFVDYGRKFYDNNRGVDGRGRRLK